MGDTMKNLIMVSVVLLALHGSSIADEWKHVRPGNFACFEESDAEISYILYNQGGKSRKNSMNFIFEGKCISIDAKRPIKIIRSKVTKATQRTMYVVKQKNDKREFWLVSESIR